MLNNLDIETQVENIKCDLCGGDEFTLLFFGNDYLFSGEWWITVFPGAALAILVLAVNLLGDWMRDAFNPKLR